MNKKTFFEELEKRKQIKFNEIGVSPLVYKHDNKIIGFICILGGILAVKLDKSSDQSFQLLNDLGEDEFYSVLMEFKIKPEKFLQDLDLLLLEFT